MDVSAVNQQANRPEVSHSKANDNAPAKAEKPAEPQAQATESPSTIVILSKEATAPPTKTDDSNSDNNDKSNDVKSDNTTTKAPTENTEQTLNSLT